MEYKALISVLAQSLSILRPLQQLWQLGDIGRYPPRLIACEQVRRRPPSGLGLEIHVSQRLTVVVADDEAASVLFFDILAAGSGERSFTRLGEIVSQRVPPVS